MCLWCLFLSCHGKVDFHKMEKISLVFLNLLILCLASIFLLQFAKISRLKAPNFQLQNLISIYNLASGEFEGVTVPYKPKIFEILPKNNIVDILKLPTANYFSHKCFKNGTLKSTKSKCFCKENFYGEFCSVPKSVWLQHKDSNFSVIKPKRIVMGIIVNHELRLTQVRFEQLGKHS